MRASFAAVLAASLLFTSCSRHRDDDRRGTIAQAGAAAGDVRIQTTSGELDMALAGDTISAGLAPDALAKVRRETDTSRVSSTGIGGSIERMVKGTVQSAVSSRVSFPVSAVKDIRYNDGAIQFEWNERPTRLFEQTKVNGRPFLASFTPEDAERFVDAVQARLHPAH